MVPMIRAYLVSFALQRLVMLGRDGFVKRHPNPWLVWEPGAWQVARSDADRTVAADRSYTQRPGQGDALCFELVPLANAAPIRVGRAAPCEIVINDATVSREHLHLTREAERWLATVCSPHGAKSGGMAKPLNARIPLSAGAQLEIGEVKLTFLDSNGFLARLDSVMAGKA